MASKIPLNQSCLIANRGEIACRIIDTCRLLGIKSVAVVAEDDQSSRHRLHADEFVILYGDTLAETYLNAKKIIEIAGQLGVTFIHPGYGFLSENASFAQQVQAAGLIWVGPNPQVISQMGSKIAAKQIAEQADVPVLPWAQIDNLDQRQQIASAAQKIGFPILVKASGGGGGMGMRIVREESKLNEALRQAANEANASFGDASVFLEKYVENPRHLEVQIMADKQGNVVHLYTRECSAQRRHQKIIEEAPVQNIPPGVRETLQASAVKLAQVMAYDNAGTVEFIYDGDSVFFLEMNTRLQVEHPVTEIVTGLDIVGLQFGVALGEELPLVQKDIVCFGHAVECRIYAEDPQANFMPCPGPVQYLEWPQMKNIRIETGICADGVVNVNYDPLVAKIISQGRDKYDAVRHMLVALEQTTILGFVHNIELLKTLLQHEGFMGSTLTTNWIEPHIQSLLQHGDWQAEDILRIAARVLHSGANKSTSQKSEDARGCQRSLFEELSL